MALPKVLSPSYWIDKCIKLILQLTLALLLQILYIVKGEDARVTDVKVTRKVTVSDNKKITQTPARATKPARQSIPVKTGSTGDSSRELKAETKEIKKPEEKITPGTLTELKPDKIEQVKEEEIPPVEFKKEVITFTAPAAVPEAQKPEDIITPEVKEDAVTFEESVEEVNVRPIDESVEEAKPVEEVKLIEEVEEVAKIIEVEEVVKSIEEAKPTEKVELTEKVDEKVEPAKEVESVEETKPVDKVEPIEEVTPPQLAPLEMKTSHELVHNNVDNTIGEIEFRWKYGGTDVFITGDFDGWKGTNRMHKDPVSGDFVAKVSIDRTKQHAFKFVVDRNWLIDDDLPKTQDEHGNENNVIYRFDSEPLHPGYKEYANISTIQYTAAAY